MINMNIIKIIKSRDEFGFLACGVGVYSIRMVFSTKYIEPIVLLFSLSLNALYITIQSYYIETLCEYKDPILFLSHNGTQAQICSNLSHYPEIEKELQADLGYYAKLRLIIEAGPPILFALPWGQLNDKLGSKFLLLIPMTGFFTYSTVFYFSTFFIGKDPIVLLLASIPVGVLGGGVALNISGLKYIVSTSTTKNRTFRLGLLEAVVQVGQPLGTLAGAQITRWFGYPSLFLFCAFLQGISILYLLLLVPNNSPPKSNPRQSNKICQWASITEALTVTCKKRPNQMILIVLMIMMCIRTFAVNGTSAVSYLYTRLQFQWGLEEFSIYTTVDGIVTAVGVIFITLVCIKLFEISNLNIGFAVLLTVIIGNFVWALANEAWLMYLGVIIQTFQGSVSILISSMISLLLPESDIGKVFALVAMIESITPIISGSIHIQIYTSTLKNLPGTVFFLSTAYHVLIFGGFLIYFWKKPKIIDDERESTNEDLELGNFTQSQKLE